MTFGNGAHGTTMCSLCGILSGRGHWTDSRTNPSVFAAREQPHTVARERQHRVRILNRVLAHYGLSVSDWSATAYVLKTRTGRTRLVSNLSELWPVAEELVGRHCDPLDHRLLASLGSGGDLDRR